MSHANHLEKIAAILRQRCTPSESILNVMNYLKSMRADFYWVGTYLLRGNELHVGPYIGPHTDHVRIPVGRGVCGTAVAENKNQIVDDVTKIENYLACNLDTRSEIVVLVRNSNGKVIGQIDIDSTKPSAFNAEDERFLDMVAAAIAPFMEEAAESVTQRT